jgi:hypothetical protein
MGRCENRGTAIPAVTGMGRMPVLWRFRNSDGASLRDRRPSNDSADHMQGFATNRQVAAADNCFRVADDSPGTDDQIPVFTDC